jgi:exodeoxyribonuclease V alpha subunit
MDERQELSGVLERFLFQSSDNGFAVFVLKSKGQDITVRGYVPGVHAGEEIRVEGAWVNHPKFGRQFEAEKCTTSLPTSIHGLQKYLASGLIKGIGPAYAERLVKKFGVNVIDIINDNPERLSEVEGIGAKRLEMIIHAWQSQKEISNVMIFLQEHGVSPAYATKIYKTYGQESIAIVKENPYRLADDIWGIGFKVADSIAQNLGFDHNSVKRIKAGIVFIITSALTQGHLYVELAKAKETTFELLELEYTDDINHNIKLALHELHEEQKIKVISHSQNHYITLAQYYFAERGVAQRILELISKPSPHAFNTDAIYRSLRAPTHERDIQLNEEQQRSIMGCLQDKVTVITGGPGTGKTTLIKKLLQILDDANLNYKLAAPTGRAAKRIMEGTKKHATTIHRLLEFDFGSRAFMHNEKNALKLDFLIVDEASMLDIFLAHSILRALPFHAHVIFIGDINQLPAVGAGNFLHDLISSKKVPCVSLKHIFRQAQDSMIIVNAHRVNNGEFPTSSLPDAKKDFIFIKEDQPENVSAHLQNIFTKGLAQFRINPDDAIVLVPMNRGIVGTQSINMTLQNILNPGTEQKQVTAAFTTFKVGDRVMHIRNNYDKHVFNGDMGTIEAIHTDDQLLLVRYPEKTVEYDFSELDELVLAYAISIHKSQGSEYQAVIIPIFMQHFTLLQRNLIYTAITRAKKLCILIGQTRAIAMGIKNNNDKKRITFLPEYLTSDLACR